MHDLYERRIDVERERPLTRFRGVVDSLPGASRPVQCHVGNDTIGHAPIPRAPCVCVCVCRAPCRVVSRRVVDAPDACRYWSLDVKKNERNMNNCSPRIAYLKETFKVGRGGNKEEV